MADEHALIRQAQQGDQNAFAALMETYQKPIFNLAYRMAGNPQDAEELCQTAFFNAWRGLSHFQFDSSFFTWLYRLTKNACIDFIRHEKRRMVVLNTVSIQDEDGPVTQLPDHGATPEEAALQGDLHQILQQGLATLSPEHRDILLMREMEGLSYQEISEAVGLELGTVKSRIARARLALRKVLLESGNYFAPPSSNETKGQEGGGAQ